MGHEDFSAAIRHFLAEDYYRGHLADALSRVDAESHSSDSWDDILKRALMLLDSRPPECLNKELIEKTARASHEVNRLYSEGMDDWRFLPWDDCSDDVKNNVRLSVIQLFANPNMTPAYRHSRWANDMASRGWVHGTTYDEESKTHPALLPYGMLPIHQRRADDIFFQIVRSAQG